MISSEDKLFFAKMRTECLELALVFGKCYKRWNVAKYKDEMDFYYKQAKYFERRMNHATM